MSGNRTGFLSASWRFRTCLFVAVALGGGGPASSGRERALVRAFGYGMCKVCGIALTNSKGGASGGYAAEAHSTRKPYGTLVRSGIYVRPAPGSTARGASVEVGLPRPVPGPPVRQCVCDSFGRHHSWGLVITGVEPAAPEKARVHSYPSLDGLHRPLSLNTPPGTTVRRSLHPSRAVPSVPSGPERPERPEPSHKYIWR